jgi:hypothetical protein
MVSDSKLTGFNIIPEETQSPKKKKQSKMIYHCSKSKEDIEEAL